MTTDWDIDKTMLVTFSGADDNVDPHDLVDISRRYPFVEWGILHSTKLCGTKRHPSGEWITKLSSLAQQHNVRLSAHLCGEMSTVKQQHVSVASLHPGFRRVQYNGMLHYEVKPEPEVAYKYEHILQVRDVGFFSAAASHAEDYPANMSVVWDASAGTGRAPEFWVVPSSAQSRCGLAGGLKPGLCAKVASFHPGWIDMESGVRTDDEFDLTKVESVLEEIERGFPLPF